LKGQIERGDEAGDALALLHDAGGLRKRIRNSGIRP
jgi:hypothetical protein